MKYDAKTIISIIDSVLDGDSPVLEWDYLINVKHRDPFSVHWSNRLKSIEENYPGSGGIMITEEGIMELRKIREELSKIGSC